MNLKKTLLSALLGIGLIAPAMGATTAIAAEPEGDVGTAESELSSQWRSRGPSRRPPGMDRGRAARHNAAWARSRGRALAVARTTRDPRRAAAEFRRGLVGDINVVNNVCVINAIINAENAAVVGDATQVIQIIDSFNCTIVN